MKYKVSLLTHQFSRDGVVAFYNSLIMQPVFVEGRIAKIMGALGNFEKADFFKALDFVPDALNLFQSLTENKIIVAGHVDEKGIVQWYADEYTGRPKVKIMYMILTDLCNLACEYCVIEQFASDHVYRHMDEKTAEKALLTFSPLALAGEQSKIILYGGEATLNWKILVYVLSRVNEMKEQGLYPQTLEVTLNSNGTTITPERARMLKELGIRAVAISLDGDEIANSPRVFKGGQASFSKVIQGFQNCVDAGIDTGISCTLSEESLARFDETLDFLLKSGVKSLGFNLMKPTKGYSVSEGYYERATECIIKAFTVFRENGIYEDRIMRKASVFARRAIFPFDCAATGGNQMVIAPDGAIGICHGTLASRENFVSHVDQGFDPVANPVWQEWSRRSPLNMPACFSCPALGICGGGCPTQAMVESGSIWDVHKSFCIHAKMILEWLIWDLYDSSVSQRGAPPAT
ncbi:hypothetical protein A3J36_02565 [Candidatus Uhrbacteria bacterium RIFCSPLOWO2_02_FULL_54_37]|uniref:Radical SAM core domain-containing protein n=2 Tax=Candidatus Uhriibacteriota TaxID=1752732 RepID=A0A1F7VKE0_9BACT|nr:MAG: hypothetical protein A3B36_01460 [Candidatus Uhrbacteria bacterium RIFCSPLOWO2_01_FULL_55_36]OGL90962.1 MAG: hypothetical protein A3J36_02565 [Candidatus Uhrbacteria bacterium RIFCSPLOWO2_02_FULL_54_37]